MVYQYGVPANIRPPPCFGKAYENENRECRNCAFQSTCRDEVVKAKNSMSSHTTSDYYRQFGYGNSPISPLRSPVAQIVPQSSNRPISPFSPQHIIPQQHYVQPQHIPPGYPPPVTYGDYGWLQDPLHHAMASAPTPMRPQMPGESFVERAAKNAGLAMAESLFMQAVLSIRQLVLAPNIVYEEQDTCVHIEPEAPRRVSLPIIQVVPEKPK